MTSTRVERLMLELVAAVREEVGTLPADIRPLGEEIKRARTLARLSLQEVADRAGFTKGHVWGLEKGRSRNPTVSVIAGLSKALGVPFLRLAQAALLATDPGRPVPHHGSGPCRVLPSITPTPRTLNE